MKIAFLILCHKNEKQINQLLDLLDDPAIDFYIHLDKKSTINKRIKKTSNIIMLPEEKRVDISWGDISMIEATKNLLETVLYSNKVYDYVWLISGQDFPIKNKYEIIKFLEDNNGNNFIEIIKETDVGYRKLLKRNELFYPDWIKKNALSSKIIKMLYIMITGGFQKTFLFKRNNNLGIKFYFGSQWWTLTYDCAKEIYNMLNDDKYMNYYANCLVPDESIIQTLYMNSSYKDSYSDKLTLVDWENQINHPKTFTIEDYDKLISSKYLIARKFDENVDEKIIDKLYTRLK